MPRSVERLFSAHVDATVDAFGPGDGLTCFFSPGRVNLMGAHLDYNGGPVMPTAIDRGTFIAMRRRKDRVVRLGSTTEPDRFEVDLSDLAAAGGSKSHRKGSWLDYPLGVLLHELERRPEAPGIELFFGGNLQIGAGLSSSASICVGTALALARAWELESSSLDLVEAALWAERDYVGVQCGIMDPYAVGFSRPDHLLWLDCRDRTTAHLPLDADRVRIAVADTGVRRALAQGEFNRRVEECAGAYELLKQAHPQARCLRDIPREVFESEGGRLSEVQRLRAQHVIDEVERTHVARAGLERGDVALFGEQMSAAHQSLRELYEVSIPELDCLVEGALAWQGCLGARLTGAGFGGCIVVLLRADACDGFDEHLSRFFRARHGRDVPVALFGGDPGPREIEGPWRGAVA